MSRELPPSLQKKSLSTRRPAIISDIMDGLWCGPFGISLLQPLLRDRGYPALDISESDAQIVVKAELPGLEPMDIELTLEADNLYIAGEKKFKAHEGTASFHRIERSFGCFQRSVVLPCPVNSEEVLARLDKGVLTIIMAKSGKETRKPAIGS